MAIDLNQLSFGLNIISPGGAEHIIEARAIKHGLPTKQFWFYRDAYFPWKAMSQWATQMSDQGYNLYLGRNPRTRNSGTDVDVDFTQCFFVDIDPERADHTKPATETEHRVTYLAAREAVSYLGCGSILDTGNGHQVWCRTDLTNLRGRRQWWKYGCDKLEEEVRKRVSEYPVVVDQMQDIARILKMPGTISKKGVPDDDHPWREVRFIDSDETILDSEWIMDLADEEEVSATKTAQIATVAVPTRFFGHLVHDRKLREAYLSMREDLSRPSSESSSEQDLALVARCRMLGYSMEEAAAILRQAPKSKAGNREDYVILTVGKVYGR